MVCKFHFHTFQIRKKIERYQQHVPHLFKLFTFIIHHNSSQNPKAKVNKPPQKCFFAVRALVDVLSVKFANKIYILDGLFLIKQIQIIILRLHKPQSKFKNNSNNL